MSTQNCRFEAKADLCNLAITEGGKTPQVADPNDPVAVARWVVEKMKQTPSVLEVEYSHVTGELYAVLTVLGENGRPVMEGNGEDEELAGDLELKQEWLEWFLATLLSDAWFIRQHRERWAPTQEKIADVIWAMKILCAVDVAIP